MIDVEEVPLFLLPRLADALEAYIDSVGLNTSIDVHLAFSCLKSSIQYERRKREAQKVNADCSGKTIGIYSQKNPTQYGFKELHCDTD